MVRYYSCCGDRDQFSNTTGWNEYIRIEYRIAGRKDRNYISRRNTFLDYRHYEARHIGPISWDYLISTPVDALMYI